MRTQLKTQWKLLAAMSVAGIFILAGSLWWFGRGPGPAAVVEIPRRLGTAAIGRHLQAAGVVRNALVFRAYVYAGGLGHKLKAGEYSFPANAGLSDVVRSLAEGRTLKHWFTIPEGFTARQIAEKLEAAGLASAGDFMALVQNPAMAVAWGLPASSLEGFLFPDTYELSKGLDPRQIAQRMLARFREKVKPELLLAGRAHGLDESGVVILASIIEREVRVPQERPRVASVFINRLEKKMRLESCATVLYSLGRTSGALSLEDLNASSPYNTYRHRGLPPAPICNPGLSALEAAAHPAATDYLFFVVRPDGQHVFSKDFEAHKRAKWVQKRARHIQDKSPDL